MGRFVAYTMEVGEVTGVFVWDRVNGSTERVDLRLDLTPASALSDLPTVSADGRYVAFSSNANGLVAGDTN